MSPSTAIVDHQGNTRRMVGMDLQRSEFEDFMNAYRPTLDVPRREVKSGASSSSSEDPKVDFGRSIKRLIKRNQTSPSIQPKNKKEPILRTSETHDFERGFINELRLPPLPSQEKRARRPWSAHLDGSGYSTPNFPEGRPRVEASPVRVIQDHNPGPPPAKNGKSKSERSSAIREVDHHQQPAKPKETPAPKINGSKTKAEKAQTAREDSQVKVLVEATVPVIQCPPPSPLTPKKKVSVKDDSRKSSETESKTIPTPEYVSSIHCLILPLNSIERYLPSKHNPDPLLSLRVIPIPERKYHVILDFQECLTFEKPRTSPSGLMLITEEDQISGSKEQRNAFDWVRESHLAVNGTLLRNVERLTEFPYVTYLVVNGSKKDLCSKTAYLKQRPSAADGQQLHFIAGYEEAVTVARPPLPQIPEQPSSENAGFIISLYQVNPGEDGWRFEQNWVTWTGARQLYAQAPEYMGLKRISIHKSIVPAKVINYALICEFTSIMDSLTDACLLVDQLRARCCGVTGMYRILDIL